MTRARIKEAGAAALIAASFVLSVLLTQRSAAEGARVVPAPAVDLSVRNTTASNAGATRVKAEAVTEEAVLAGGCFWGVQGVFQHVDGVVQAVSGYAGGEERTAVYETVSSGSTGHAEAVRITYDPRRISYGLLLQIYFSVAHDPTQLNRQGPDRGTQYRSAIFPTNPEQAHVANAYIAQLDGARVFDKAVATKVEPGHSFYPAEAYHQDFMERHPSYPYIVVHDAPKVANLERLFPDHYRSEPKLVAAAE